VEAEKAWSKIGEKCKKSKTDQYESDKFISVYRKPLNEKDQNQSFSIGFDGANNSQHVYER
jgi:hypothetical protein